MYKKLVAGVAMALMLSTQCAEAFPHGGPKPLPPRPMPVHHHVPAKHKFHRDGVAWAVAGTILGVAALASGAAHAQPVQTVVVNQPVTTSNCTTTYQNGVQVQQCTTMSY